MIVEKLVPPSHLTKVTIGSRELLLKDEYYTGDTFVEVYQKLSAAIARVEAKATQEGCTVSEGKTFVLYRQGLASEKLAVNLFGEKSEKNFCSLIAAILWTPDMVTFPWEP